MITQGQPINKHISSLGNIPEPNFPTIWYVAWHPLVGASRPMDGGMKPSGAVIQGLPYVLHSIEGTAVSWCSAIQCSAVQCSGAVQCCVGATYYLYKQFMGRGKKWEDE